MRWIGLLLLGLLLSCQPDTPKACVVIEAVSVEEGFRVKGTNSADVTIRRGECIEFVNQDSTVHIAQTRPGSGAPEDFSTQNLTPDPAYKVKIVLNIAGEYEYICSINTGTVVHAQTMFGKITVR